MTRSRLFAAVAAASVFSGILLAWWPFGLLGVVIAALGSDWFFAVTLGLLLDLAWGPPVGAWHILPLPFTFLALMCAFARWTLGGRLRAAVRLTL